MNPWEGVGAEVPPYSAYTSISIADLLCYVMKIIQFYQFYCMNIININLINFNISICFTLSQLNVCFGEVNILHIIGICTNIKVFISYFIN